MAVRTGLLVKIQVLKTGVFKTQAHVFKTSIVYLKVIARIQFLYPSGTKIQVLKSIDVLLGDMADVGFNAD